MLQIGLPLHFRPQFGARHCTYPTLPLSPSAHREIEHYAQDLLARNGGPESERELLFLAEAVSQVIEHVVPQLAAHMRFALAPESIGVAIVHNVPHANETIAKVVSLAIGLLHGQPFAFSSQNLGRLCAVVQAVTGAPLNSNASAEEFGYHTDDAILLNDHRVERISLLGICNERNTKTYYSPLEYVLAELESEPHCLGVLREPRFKFRVPASFGMGLDLWSSPRPILWENTDGVPCISCSSYATLSAFEDDNDANNALSRLLIYIERHARPVVASPGTLITFDNNRGLHSRAKVEGRRRLLRSYFRDDLNALRKDTGDKGNVFDVISLLKRSPS